MNEKFFAHPTSIIDRNVNIGNGTKVWQFCHVCEGASIGDNCNIGQNCYIGKNVIIGNNCKIQNNVSVYEGVQLSDYVFCGPSMVFTNDLTPRCMFPKKSGDYKKTAIGLGATIGANATVVCGNSIGSFALVGAGAVVTKDVPDYAIVAGNPARIMGYACKCGMKMTFAGDTVNKYICKECGRKYSLEEEKLYEDDE